MASRMPKPASSHGGLPTAARLQVARDGLAPRSSPARVLHHSLVRQLAVPAPEPISVAQRFGMISLLAGLSWAVVGSGAYLLIH
jgi:hypothetical protein